MRGVSEYIKEYKEELKEEKHDKEEIPERLQAFCNKQRYRTGSQRYTGNKGAGFIRQPDEFGQLGDADAPADCCQENVLLY